jgi:hypothetical protein
MVFHVTETYIVPKGTTKAQMVGLVQKSAELPFRLTFSGTQEDTHFVSLHREPSTPAELAAHMADRSDHVADGSADLSAQPEHQEQPEGDQPSAEEANKPVAYKEPRPPSYPPPQADDDQKCSWSEASWNPDSRQQKSGWRSSGSGCHVCGKTRVEHFNKKFCSVKKARH